MLRKSLYARSSDTTYTAINYTLIPITEEAEQSLEEAYQNVRAGGSKRIEDVTDSAGCVSAYSVINWKDIVENNREYITLTSVSGGYSAQGSGSSVASGVTVTSHKVTVGQTGLTSGSYEEQYKTFNIGTSNRSYSYNSSNWSSFVPVESSSGRSIVGTSYEITLKRESSTWECVVSNNY